MAPGLKIRFRRVKGLTAKGVLTERMYLPVATGEFTYGEEAVHREYDTHAAGSFSVPAQGGRAARQLIEIGDLETMTLDWGALPPWMHDHDPEEVKRTLRRILRSKTPVELLATLNVHSGIPEELRCLVTLRRIDVTLRPGEADTRYWTIQVREYREIETERRSRDARDGRLPTTHKLKASDTAHSLSDLYYRTTRYWRTILRANGIPNWGQRTEIVKHSKYRVGDTIKIPRKPEEGVAVMEG